MFARSRLHFLRSPVLVLVLAFSIQACGGGGESAPSPPASNRQCPADRCVDIDEASAILGFEVLEPSYIPDDFEMERRELVGSLEPGAPSPGGSGTTEALGPPTSILTDFRFRGSVALPGITVLQSVLPFTAMRPVRPDCAEIISTESGPLFYINGPYSFEISEDGAEFMLCRDMSMPPRDVHHVITVRGGTLVEVIAFPEVRVSKEEIIEMVKSLQPAETEHAKP